MFTVTGPNPQVSFHEAVRRARRVVQNIRENGQMKSTEFRHGFYKRCMRSATPEADLLDKYLDDILKAHFDEGTQRLEDDTSPKDQEEIPF